MANPSDTTSDRQAIYASLALLEARLAAVSDIIRDRMQRRYWQGYWAGSRAFLGSVRRAREKGG